MPVLGKKTVRAWNRLQRAHARLTAAVEESLKAAGLPPLGWHPLLEELERGPPEGMRPFELEEASGEAQYNISRQIDRMTRAGLVRRAPCVDDRRGWRIVLTDDGRAMRARMWDVCSATLLENFVDRLGDKRIKALDGILGDLVRREPRVRD